MNKKIYLKVFLYLVFVLLLAFLFLIFGRQKDFAGSNSAEQITPSLEEDTLELSIDNNSADIFSGSFLDLLKKGKDYKCIVDTTSMGSVSSGIVYVSDNKIRADFESIVPSFGEIMASVIAKDNYVYTWNSMSKIGMKTPQNNNYDSSETKSQEFDLNYSYSYNCTPFVVDKGLFELPNGFSFQES